MEYRKRCKVCGHIFCYTDEDLKNNNTAAIMSGLSAIGSIAGALSGNWMAARANQAASFHEEDKQKDFYHCPNCNSADIADLTDDEFEEATRSATTSAISINSGASIDSLIKRIRIFLEDGDFKSASAYCEHALDLDPENGDIYFLKQMIEWKVKSIDEIVARNLNFKDGDQFSKIDRYASSELRTHVEDIEKKIKKNAYEKAVNALKTCSDKSELSALISKFRSFEGFADSDIRIKECERRIEELNDQEKRIKEEKEESEKKQKYQDALSTINRTTSTVEDLNQALASLNGLKDWKDVDKDIESCNARITELSNIKQKRKRVYGAIIAGIIVCIIAFLCWSEATKDSRDQKNIAKAYEQMVSGNYDEAAKLYKKVKGQESYAEYCTALSKLENIKAGDEIGDLYRALRKDYLKNFDDLCANYDWLRTINDMQGTWYTIWSFSVHDKISVQGSYAADLGIETRFIILAGNKYGVVSLKEEEKGTSGGTLELKFDGTQLYWDKHNEMYSRNNHDN